MPRIKLAFWHGDHKPGDEIEVNEDELAALRRDGRVAEVLGYDQGGSLPAALVEARNESDEPEAVISAPPAAEGRGRKAR